MTIHITSFVVLLLKLYGCNSAAGTVARRPPIFPPRAPSRSNTLRSPNPSPPLPTSLRPWHTHTPHHATHTHTPPPRTAVAPQASRSRRRRCS